MASEPPVYEVFFTGNDDPRDGCVVIGEDTKPIFYRFDTPPAYVGNPRTTVSVCVYVCVAFWAAVDLIYPLSDNVFQPSRPLRIHKGLSERRGDRRLSGLDRRGLSARSPHDRQPSITHDPVRDAWIDRQVSLGFRLFGPQAPFHPHHTPPLSPHESPSPEPKFPDPQTLPSTHPSLFALSLLAN